MYLQPNSSHLNKSFEWFRSTLVENCIYVDQRKTKVYLKSVVSPGSEFEITDLIIKRKVSYVNVTGALKLFDRWPVDLPVMVDKCSTHATACCGLFNPLFCSVKTKSLINNEI